MPQVTYKTERVSKKRVFYTGSSILLTGYALCYDFDATTGASGDPAWKVEKPVTTNLKYFAGVLDQSHDGKTGPCWVDILEPQPGTGRLVQVRKTGASGSAGTKWGVTNASWELEGASSSKPQVALQSQTGAASSDETVLMWLTTDTDADFVTQTAPTLTGGTTGATVGITGTTATLAADLLRLADASAKNAADVAAIVTALVTAGIMDPS